MKRLRSVARLARWPHARTAPPTAASPASPSRSSRIEPLESRLLFVAGELDTTFSSDGKEFTDFGNTDTARAVVVQPDGKTVVAGDWAGTAPDFALARYTALGFPDTTFDGDGKANLTFGAPIFGGEERATAVALQADGKIVAAGYTDAAATSATNPFDFAVARFNADGSLDTSFSGDGKFTYNFGHDDRAAAVAIQGDGKIVVAGSWDGGNSDFVVLRLNPNGTLDTTFNDVAAPTLSNGDGKANVFFGLGITSSSEFATSIALTPAGKIVVGGYTTFGTSGTVNTNDFAVAVLNPNGTLDTSFSGDGRHTINYGWDDRATAIAVDRKGRIVLAGYDDGGSADFAVARLTSAGALDTGFNGTGQMTFNVSFAERAYGIALEPNGVDQEIYLAGYTRATALGSDDFVLARLRPNGTLDAGFGGGDGIQITDMGGSDQAYGAAMGADGKVVVAGTTAGNFAVARYLGELDPAFDLDGRQTADFGWTDVATGVAIQPNGRIVTVGYDDGGNADFAITRTYSDGTLDPSFNDVASPTESNGDGKLSFTFSPAGGFGGTERATCVALQPDGKIVVAGYTDAGSTGALNPFDFAVARVNPNGTLDTSFSGDGKFAYNFGHDDRVAAVAIQPDGKIVLVGQWDGGASDFAIVRLNPDGSLDTTFNDVASPEIYNGDGRLSVGFGGALSGSVERATAVALRPDGRIVVGGYTNDGGTPTNPNNFAIVSINPNGTLDTSFSGDGRFTVDFGYNDQASSIAIRPAGQIVIGGTSLDGNSDFAVAQVRGDVLDISFGGGDGMLRAFSDDASEVSTGMALLDNGKILMTGYSNSATGTPNNFAVARILANGSSTDPTFNADGEHFIDFGGDDKAYAVAVGPDRKAVVVGTSNGNFAAARLDSAPVVTQVYVNSTAWTPAFRSYLASHGMGSVDFGYAVPAGLEQLNELPWINIDEVTVTFSELITLPSASDDMAIRGVNVPNYALSPVGPVNTPFLRGITWSLPAGIVFGKDKVLLDLDGDSITGVHTLAGATLDGDWSGVGDAFPSGNGAGGGDFRFRINVLPGDTTRSGSVLADDYSAVKKKFFSTTTSPVTGTDADYSPFHDVDGSGNILANDFSEVKRRFFDSLPGPEPAALPPVVLLAADSALFGAKRIRPAAEVLA